MEDNGNTAGHTENHVTAWAFSDLPKRLQDAFAKDVTDGGILTVEDFTFSFGPITYHSDSEDDMAGGVDEGEEAPTWQAYTDAVDELWRDAGEQGWVLYNY